jgi:predicted DNA-binding protein with PD1-like motif
MKAAAKETGKIMGRVPQGEDLLGYLNQVCLDENIQAGQVNAIGAVSKATIGFYDQARQVYEFLDFNEPMEIVALMGNVSIKDGKPFVHAHVVFGNHTGKLLGGHLAEGAPVFACEFIITKFDSDQEFVRGLDQGTGLPLWQNLP